MTVVLVCRMSFFDFAKFPNLTQFHTETSMLSSIAGIKSCKKLEIVNIINDVTLQDFRPLLELPKLRIVHLRDICPVHMPSFPARITSQIEVDNRRLIFSED